MLSSRSIPTSIRRQVRQNSGFCCVICGELPCEYEHIIPLSECREHDVSNITLLCPNHHAEVTAGRLSKEVVREHQREPFAFTSGLASYAFRHAKVDTIRLGGVSVKVQPDLLLHIFYSSGSSLFNVRIENNIPIYNAELHGVDSGNLMIEENTILSSPDMWDFEQAGKGLTAFAEKDFKILDLTLKDSVLIVNVAKIFADGRAVVIGEHSIEVFYSTKEESNSMNGVVLEGDFKEIAAYTDGSFEGDSIFSCCVNGRLSAEEAKAILRKVQPNPQLPFDPLGYPKFWQT